MFVRVLPEIPKQSAFNKQSMSWKLMSLLPGMLPRDEFAMLRHYLNDDTDKRKLFQLASRTADLYDQYLVYRPEWLTRWEAGISFHAGDKFDDAPAVSYPAKLTRLLFERFSHFNGAADKGWVIIPCELIDYNGEALHELVLRYAQEWALPAAFTQWLNDANSFCSTLVDRIVTGYPRDEVAELERTLGYHDAFLDTARNVAHGNLDIHDKDGQAPPSTSCELS
jgi:hypothetical protein